MTWIRLLARLAKFGQKYVSWAWQNKGTILNWINAGQAIDWIIEQVRKRVG